MNAKHELLTNFARRLEQEPDFMAHVLRLYMDQEQMDERQVADHLGLDAAALTRLALCRVPRPDPDHFIPDVRRIADFTGANAVALTRMLRQTAAVRVLQQGPALQADTAPSAEGTRPIPFPQPGLLAAARDREDAPDAAPPAPPAPPPDDEEV